MTKDIQLRVNFRFLMVLGILITLFASIGTLVFAGSSSTPQEELISTDILPAPNPAPSKVNSDFDSINSTIQAAGLAQDALGQIMRGLNTFKDGRVGGIELTSAQILILQDRIVSNINVADQRILELKSNFGVTPARLADVAIAIPVEDYLYDIDIKATAVAVIAEANIQATAQAVAEAEANIQATIIAGTPTAVNGSATSTQ